MFDSVKDNSMIGVLFKDDIVKYKIFKNHSQSSPN